MSGATLLMGVRLGARPNMGHAAGEFCARTRMVRPPNAPRKLLRRDAGRPMTAYRFSIRIQSRVLLFRQDEAPQLLVAVLAVEFRK